MGWSSRQSPVLRLLFLYLCLSYLSRSYNLHRSVAQADLFGVIFTLSFTLLHSLIFLHQRGGFPIQDVALKRVEIPSLEIFGSSCRGGTCAVLLALEARDGLFNSACIPTESPSFPRRGPATPLPGTFIDCSFQDGFWQETLAVSGNPQQVGF